MYAIKVAPSIFEIVFMLEVGGGIGHAYSWP